jgi:ATP-binding protein involved in chromosome partitioning
MAMPDEIVGLLLSKITIRWPDGHTTVYPARDLRLACRCAMCIEETSGRPLLDPSTVPGTVRAKAINLVGQYAISISWSDGHDTGIYNFRDLRGNCPCPTCTDLRATGRIPT